MNSDLLTSLSPFLLSGALTLAIGIFCLGRKDVPGARAYGVNALAKSAMIAGFVMETASHDLSTKVYWDTLQYVPMFIAPLALLVFAHQFTGRPFRLLLWKGLALGAFPFLFLTLVFIDPASVWIATGQHLQYGTQYSVLKYSFGPLLVAAAGYLYVVLALAFLVLIAELRRVPRHCRTQIKIVMLGMMIPVLGGVFTVFDWSPLLHRDLTPVTFGLASGVVAWGLFRHNLFRRSLIEFEQIWHDLTEGIIVTDRDGIIVAVNPAAVRLLEGAHGLVPGGRLQNALKEAYPQLHAAFISHLASGMPVFNEFQANPRFLQIGVRALTGFSGAPLGAVLQVHDDTREKALQEWLRAEASSSESTARRAEERLHENQEQLEMALAGAELGTWDWKVQTGEVTFNSRWIEMLGLEKHEIEPRIESWEQVIHPDDLSRARELLQAHLDGRTPVYETEHRWQHKNGSWVWVLSRGKVSSRDSEGRPLRASGTHLDVTARRENLALQKELGEKLQRAERMESLGLLAGGVAHDLNNLLAPVVGYSQILLKELEDRPEFAKRVQRIERAGKDAAELVQDLLALARRGRYEMKPLDLNLLVSDLLESPALERLCQRQPAVKVVKILSAEPAVISGSEAHLKKAILNLLVNAFDAMSECEQGTLSLTVSQSHLQQLDSGFAQLRAGRYVKVSVADTGKGIASADRHRIFEPYFSKKAMTGSSGSGLGLSVVYGVLKDHGGYYELFSDEGMRTEFLLYFPASDLHADVHPAEAKVARGTETVLVVDDSLDQRDLVRDMLGSLGYQVFTVENGYEAVAFLQTRKADIVVLDMIMADSLDGLDTYRELLKVQPTQRALIVSGYSATERVEEACRLGAGAYVRKPYTLEQIGNALRQELDRTEPPVARPLRPAQSVTS